MQSDVLLVLVIAAVVLFGGSQIPKLARSLGQAKKEFEKGQTDDTKTSTSKSKKTDDEA